MSRSGVDSVTRDSHIGLVPTLVATQSEYSMPNWESCLRFGFKQILFTVSVGVKEWGEGLLGGKFDLKELGCDV